MAGLSSGIGRRRPIPTHPPSKTALATIWLHHESCPSYAQHDQGKHGYRCTERSRDEFAAHCVRDDLLRLGAIHCTSPREAAPTPGRGAFSGPSRKRLGEDVFYSAQDESSGPTSRAIREHQLVAPVCTENLIRVDDVMESPKLAECSGCSVSLWPS
jgi:hypothetical protein